jgi:hypothetical protein
MRRTRWVAAVLALSLVAAACGDDDEGGESTDTTAAAETTTTAAAEDGGETTTTAAAEDGGEEASGPISIDPETGRLVAGECAEGTANADEALGVTEDTVNIATLGIDYGPLADIGFAPSGEDGRVFFQALVDELNANGGVCGRQIDYQGVSYDIIRREGPQGCLQVTEDRRNAVVFVQGGTPEAVCVAESGTVTYAQHEFAVDDVAAVQDLLFMRAPSWEEQLEMTVQWALDNNLLQGKKVGLWYGAVFPTQGAGVESVVIPALEEAGIDFIPYRTDYLGPSDPQGNAVLLAAATDFVANEIDVLFNATQTTNHVGIKSEMSAQGFVPEVMISAPIGANSSNALFETAYATGEISDGQQIFSYTIAPNEAPDGPFGPALASCNEQVNELTGAEAFEPGTFDYAALANFCFQFDMMVALLTYVGPEITQEKLVEAFEALPPHPTSLGYSGNDWNPGERFPTGTVYGVHLYDAATNTYTTTETIEP